MSMRLLEEGCESLLAAFNTGEVFAIRDGEQQVTREMAENAVLISGLDPNESNIKTAIDLIPQVADFLIREGDVSV